RARTLSPRPETLAALGHAYAVAGRRDDALRIIESLKALPNRSTSYQIAMIYAGLEDQEHALEWLRTAYAESDGLLSLRLNVDPVFDNLRANPQFKELLHRIGFTT